MSFPLFSRRIEYLRLPQKRDELPSTFLQRIMVESTDARMSECSEAGLAMSLFAACLPDNDLNSRIKDLLLESLRKKPNPKGIEKVLGKIQALEADFNAKQVTKKRTRDNVRRVGSEDNPAKDIACRVCEKTHQRGKCGYACRHCGYKGSHKSSSCWEKFPHLKQKRGRSPSRKRGEKQKDKKREKSPFPKKKIRARQVSESDKESDRASETEVD